MRTNGSIRSRAVFLLALLPLFLVPTAGAEPPSDAVLDRMEAIAGRLLINDGDLKEAYRDLHGFAQYSLSGEDRQLNYIQRLYLTVDRARIQGYYLWRILSVFDYLQRSSASDFLTLYTRDLRQAKEDCRLAITLIELYSAYVEKKEVRKTAREAAGIIEANVYMYEKLETLLAPYVNKPPYPRRID